MNKKIFVIIILTIIALFVLTMFSFGPLSGKRKSASINPVSQKPESAGQVPIENKTIEFSSYHNKDMKENYYTVNLPKDWQTKSGQNAGSYDFAFPEGNGAVELMDVPDNTTLELFILSQQEPSLKKSLNNYTRKDYKKIIVNSNDAYELTFNSINNGQSVSTIKTYIAGPDHATVITLNIQSDRVAQFTPVYTAIVNSFNWENK
jgi:hypothetical protein